MFVVSESKDSQSALFAVMYDREALYLAGVVRDTSPMVNRQDPRVKGDRGWDADSCQFRLTVDSTQAYPVEESAHDYRGKNAKVDTRDDIKHLTLWYFTDRAEPCLQMHMGMSFRLPNPNWAPHGVVPADRFEAKYVQADDGRGYTFEYRIPWSTLGAKKPIAGGQMVAGTVQFNWGTADGLKTGGGAAWAYDVMAGPGFVYQNAAVWGRLIFAQKGNVARELVDEGVPTAKPNPLQLVYDLPEDGQVTLQLFDQDQLVRRILVAQADRRKGRNVEPRDGMDDQGKPLPAGTYRVRGIIHKPITSEFLFSVHNSGNPPYPTDDNRGGWGGDHGDPTACSELPDGMLLSWDGCEYGWGIIRVDHDGRKQWGIKTNALFLANDGKRFFVYDPHGFQAAEDIAVLDATGRLLRRIGRAGGRPAIGPYDANGVYLPNGIAVDKRGRLWVAEHADSPKRVSLWNAKTGAFQREFFGGCSYFAYAHINPAVPDEIVCHNVIWHVDWKKKTTQPISTIWRKTAPDMIEPARPDGYQGVFNSMTADNGNQYALGGGQLKTIVFRPDGDLQWGYPSILPWPKTLSLPVVKAGRLHGMTGPLGVAGNFSGNMSYFGVCHLFQRDGIYAAAIMRDGRTGGMGADIGQPEGQGGRLVRIATAPGATPRTFLLCGGQDARVTEIHGLNTIKSLPSWEFTLTPEQAKIAADELASYNARFPGLCMAIVGCVQQAVI